MAFGKHVPALLGAMLRERLAARPEPARAGRGLAGLALVGLLLGFCGMTAGTTLVQASERSGLLGFFEDLFRPAAPTVAVPRRAAKRYASLPDARRLSASRPHRTMSRPAVDLSESLRRTRRAPFRTEAMRGAAPPVWPGRGPRTVCVRTCDGYLFPLGTLRSRKDLPVHQAACAAACPNAPIALFTLPRGRTELDQAVSLKGRPYLAAAWANVFRQRSVQNCSCQPQGVAATPLPVARDSTIRIGDIVANEDSADVVTNLSEGTVQLVDYRGARGLSRRTRWDIERQVGTMRRDAEEAAFRRTLRQAERKTDRVRVAEAGFLKIRVTETAGSFGEPVSASETRQAFAPVRMVAPPLYGH